LTSYLSSVQYVLYIFGSQISDLNFKCLTSILFQLKLLRSILLDHTDRFHVPPNGYIWNIIPKSTQTSNIKSSLSVGPLWSCCYCYNKDSESVFVVCHWRYSAVHSIEGMTYLGYLEPRRIGYRVQLSGRVHRRSPGC
jgi:hypothetical protein